MNYLKKIMCFLTSVILVVALSGCGAKSPSNVLSEKLDSIKKGDNKAISEILESQIQDEEGSTFENTEIEKNMIAAIQKITYKINSETIDGNSAKVNVTVNGPDVADALSQFIDEAFSYALSNAFSEDSMTDEEMNAEYEKMFAEILENVKFSDRTMDIEMVKENNEWKVKDDNDLIKLVTNIDPDAFEENIDLSDN
ncbi:hypothetical protein [uncultured Clostridium sp.]|uniref:hypothetical protein n=1 Tax=uncultured Clostridium sp. TaxID=59620 RepID=UPI0025ECB01F|nr:hypothetical protein [uncultured Clostridium sp.]